MKSRVTIFWFRRDLRLDDNSGLCAAIEAGHKVLPLFICDSDILDHLPRKNDRRVDFISQALQLLDKQLRQRGSGLLVKTGKPCAVFTELITEFQVDAVYANEDYEPYARQRDEEVRSLLSKHAADLHLSRDQCVFGPTDILKENNSPYSVFTPYMKKWKAALSSNAVITHDGDISPDRLLHFDPPPVPSLKKLGFESTGIRFIVPELASLRLGEYAKERDLPYMDSTTRLGIHLRFGTISIRRLVREALEHCDVFLGELAWREFFMMILWHFPRVTRETFKPEYSHIRWRNNEKEFDAWREGRTGYPLVDAGMRQLNETGFMHNRVRMVTASFLVKHLLVDWQWGEAYFAERLDDFELSSNNGNWQWVAGCGCDAAPYFRLFNPDLQQKRFDPEFRYVRRWLPEFGTADYQPPIVAHAEARQRALSTYGKALEVIRRGELF